MSHMTDILDIPPGSRITIHLAYRIVKNVLLVAVQQHKMYDFAIIVYFIYDCALKSITFHRNASNAIVEVNEDSNTG